MAFKNLKAEQRLKNIINGGDDGEFVRSLQSDYEEVELPPKEKDTKKTSTRKAPPKRPKKKTPTVPEKEYSYDIVDEYYTESIGTGGKWNLEVNKIIWSEGSEAKFDIRKWKYDDEGNRDFPAKQGISFTDEQMERVVDSLVGIFYDMGEDE